MSATFPVKFFLSSFGTGQTYSRPVKCGRGLQYTNFGNVVTSRTRSLTHLSLVSLCPVTCILRAAMIRYTARGLKWFSCNSESLTCLTKQPTLYVSQTLPQLFLPSAINHWVSFCTCQGLLSWLVQALMQITVISYVVASLSQQNLRPQVFESRHYVVIRLSIMQEEEE